ncbi:hypothetical protein HBN50_01705 [Halobacteriovorax sp. GB3]|uniref:hypothetical protein n=1 Tax=Halobacteriovorax sp. GB3 TaxID=2719615 RepID=UPI0023603C12|nr:hypothetical protein [Halobacteriovorax sp. GB3]MDD0851785.1 hypothetical protein [Halobacteriovorax sp. GB3]
MKNRGLIIGHGHVSGFVVELLKSEFQLFGTKRIIPSEQEEDIEIISLELAQEDFDPRLFEDYHFVLFLLPPREHYLNFLISMHEKSSIDIPWIFTSSTSVYGSGIVREYSPREGTGRNSASLIELEEFLESIKRDVVILRPAGLVDEKRNPINFFKKAIEQKREVQGGSSPVNLVHSNDVARFIQFILENKIRKGVFNLCSDTHLEKREFYGKLMQHYQMELPRWSKENGSYKVVSNELSKESGFHYLYPDLFSYFLDF